MPQQWNHVVIENPHVEFVSSVGEVLKSDENGRWDLHLTVSDSALDGVVESCRSHELRFSVAPFPTGTVGGTSSLNYPPPLPSYSDRVRSGESDTPVPNGGTSRESAQVAVDHQRVPNRADYETTTEWLAVTAEHFGVEEGVLQELISTYAEEADLEQNRRTLELVFAHHLERVPKGEQAHVDIQIADSRYPIRYHYLDNGPGRGGAHLFQDVTREMKAEITCHATEVDLDVLADGEGFLSVSFCEPTVKDDVSFAERIISDVLGGSLADIVRIDEVIDLDETRIWLD